MQRRQPLLLLGTFPTPWAIAPTEWQPFEGQPLLNLEGVVGHAGTPGTDNALHTEILFTGARGYPLRSERL